MSQAAQRSAQREDTTVSGALGGLQGTDPTTLATAFGRGISVPLSTQGQPVMDMSAAGLVLPGGLQLGGMMTPMDRPILNMPRGPAVAPQVADSRITYDPSTQLYTYHGVDAAQIFAISGSQACSTDWA